MTRFIKISKNFAQGFVLVQLSLIGLGILLIVAIIKVVDTLWRLVTASLKKPLKRFQSPVTIKSASGEETLEALLSTDTMALDKTPEVAPPVHDEDSLELMLAIERYSSVQPAHHDDFDDDNLDDAHIVGEVAQPSIRIEILRRDEAPEPNLPSTFFPGCGSDGAQFKVLDEDKPSYDEITGALYRWADDACLIRYDGGTGVGYFRIVDGYAPEAGSVIDLE